MKPEFIESELELFVQRILTHELYTLGTEYQLLKVSPNAEKHLGYDAKIIGLTPFYCQFKTSHYVSSGSNYNKRERFCRKSGWPVRAGYTFELRRPSDKSLLADPSAWQHNILHSLWESNPSAVAYVAPTFHTRLAMHAMEPRPAPLHCPLIPLPPLQSHTDVNTVSVNGRDRARLPTFMGLVSIPPHTEVKSLKHFYFYSNHRDVTFHSDPTKVDGAATFGEFLLDNVQRTLKDDSAPEQHGELTVNKIAEMTGLRPELANHALNYGKSLIGRLPDNRLGFDGLSRIDKQIVFSYALETFFGIATFAVAKHEIKS